MTDSKTYPPFYETVFERIVGHEGSYVLDSRDPGGETKFGISKRSYPTLNIKELTLSQAKAIWFHDFWMPVRDLPSKSLAKWPPETFRAWIVSWYSGNSLCRSWESKCIMHPLNRWSYDESRLTLRLYSTVDADHPDSAPRTGHALGALWSQSGDLRCGAAHVLILGAVAQCVVHEHQGQHGLGDRGGADAHAGVMAAMGIDDHRIAGLVDGAAVQADAGGGFDGHADQDVLAGGD